MLNNGNKQNCGFTHEIVSFIYGEIGSPERRQFEKHLADCSACTDEFAAISTARFSVFEWQKEEFANLSTPRIVIPYESATLGPTSESIGPIAAVRAWLSRLSFPVAVAAGLLVCIGLTLLVITFLGRQQEQVATNAAVPAVRSDTVPEVRPVSEQDPVRVEVKDVVNPFQPTKAMVSQPKQAVRHASPDVHRPSNNFAVTDRQTQQIRKAPALNSYEDNDDSSLRLADLFDEVGG